MKNIIIGTAGHIDHGKTALIKALNGFDGDELKEEIERAITINLSFSNLKIASSVATKNIAFIDVPGHENLIKTMISGAYQMDAAMLVIAANEGVKAQSIEHLMVLRFLGVRDVILVINKCDLVEPQTAQNALNSAFNAIKDIGDLRVIKSFFVSAKSGDGVSALKEFLAQIPPKKHDINGLFRFYIDRVFSKKGFGCVVTGGVLRGSISVGDEVLCLQSGERLNIRAIQMHNSSADMASAPSRAALNLNGKTQKIRVGQILSKAGFYRGFSLVDCEIAGEIKHNSQVILCVGSAQIAAKAARLNERFYSFKLNEEAFLEFGERFVLLAGGRVVGGGRVLNAVSEPMKKGAKIALLEALAVSDFKSAFGMLTQAHAHGFGLISSQQRFNIKTADAIKIAKSLSGDGVYVDERSACVYGSKAARDIEEFIDFIISKNPRAMMSANSLNLKMSWASVGLINMVLNDLKMREVLDSQNGVFIKKGVDFNTAFNEVQSEIFKMIDKMTPESPYNIYDALDIDRASGDEALKQLTSANKAARLAHNLFISQNELNKVMAKIRQIIDCKGAIGVGELKAELMISRKYAIAFLEHLDRFGDIIRDGDKRRLVATELRS